jgi:hypothetical protein
MDTNLQTRTQSQPQAASPVLADVTRKPWTSGGSTAVKFTPVAAEPELRFPPTRAARAARSRGVFLREDESGASERPRWIEIPVAMLALAAAAFALVVCVNATSLVGGPSVGANPGPAIVAAASVTPAFVEPVKLR